MDSEKKWALGEGEGREQRSEIPHSLLAACRLSIVLQGTT